LDPAASGVLPIAIGKAAKFFDYFLEKDKVYIARVKFGIETDTLDSFGAIVDKNSKIVKKDEILAILSNFIGKIKQVPPKYSAIKINGKKACDLARENVDFEIKAKEIEIFDIKLLDDFGDNEFLFKVHCSAGTYIRTLFADIAKILGTVSTTTTIIRAKSGLFSIEESILLDDIEELKIMPIKKLFKDKKNIEVNENIAKKLINGVKVFANELTENLDGEFFVSYKNKTIGFYKIKDERLETIAYLIEN
jgi:tRNA pseudouridine55 synthase